MAAAGIVSTVQDVITALLPNFIYWKAQIPLRQKIALMAIFATAYAVAAFGALRTYSTWVLFYETYDVSWQLWEIWNWTLLELHIGVICANTPALKVFVKKYLPGIKSIVSRQQATSSQPRTPETPSSQAKSSQTRSQTSSNPSGKSKKSGFWKNPYAHLGYFSQATQHSTEERISEETEKDTLHHRHISEDSTLHARHYTEDDVELGILRNAAPCPAQPADTHRGSVGLVSVYMYDDQHDSDNLDAGLQYLRVKI